MFKRKVHELVPECRDVFLNGERTKIPEALYIPPEALEIYLENFSGPLDLLCYLIRQAKIDIFDIPMTLLTEQYLVYVDRMRQRNLALASEYLLMAALLIDIKARSLLPGYHEDSSSSDAGESNPRDELVRRLLVYEQISGAAAYLSSRSIEGRDYHAVFLPQPVAFFLPVPDIQDLVRCWRRLLQTLSWQQPHPVVREPLVVSDFMDVLRKNLTVSRFLVFQDLCGSDMAICYHIVYFLAILELAKLREIEISQEEPFLPLYFRKK